MTCNKPNIKWGRWRKSSCRVKPNFSWDSRFCGTQSVHDYSARGHFATGEAHRFKKWAKGAVFCRRRVAECIRIVRPAWSRNKWMKRWMLRWKNFPRVQVNSIDIQFRKNDQPSRYKWGPGSVSSVGFKSDYEAPCDMAKRRVLCYWCIIHLIES